MIQRLPLTKARINLGAVIRRLHATKEHVVLEKDGIPIAGLMNIDDFEDYLELRDPKAKRDIVASAQDYRRGKIRPVESLLAELRAADARGHKQRRSRA